MYALYRGCQIQNIWKLAWILPLDEIDDDFMKNGILTSQRLLSQNFLKNVYQIFAVMLLISFFFCLLIFVSGWRKMFSRNSAQLFDKTIFARKCKLFLLFVFHRFGPFHAPKMSIQFSYSRIIYYIWHEFASIPQFFYKNSLLFETDGEIERRRETRHTKNKVIQADINASVNIMLWFFHKSFLSYATNFGISRRIVKNLNRSVNKLECMFSE